MAEHDLTFNFKPTRQDVVEKLRAKGDNGILLAYVEEKNRTEAPFPVRAVTRPILAVKK